MKKHDDYGPTPFSKLLLSILGVAAFISIFGLWFAIYLVRLLLELFSFNPDTSVYYSAIICVAIFVGVAGAYMARCELSALESYKNKQLEKKEKELETKQKELDTAKKAHALEIADYEMFLSEHKQKNPLISLAIADLQYERDKQKAVHLRTKKHPAIKAADNVKLIAKEKRDILAQCKSLEYQLAFYELCFPWLTEFKELDAAEAYSYASGNAATDEYDSLRDWLSPVEYEKLSSQQKYQLALDRYFKKSKSNWEAGIAYERYIGYIYESQGYQVDYVGAKMGKEDRGVDLVASSQKQHLIIQCKRYSKMKNKVVHENTVAQLYGVAAVYKMENPSWDISAIIYSTTDLSKEAKRFAEYLGITVKDNFPLSDYPLIKCNISKDGSKIYHLPFDQQYDKIVVSTKKGEFYASTIAEAEKKGFRRAYRWSGNKNN